MLKRRIIWGGCVLLSLVLFLFDNNDGTLALLLTVALVPALSGLSLLLFKPVVSAALEVPERLERGEGEPCTLVLTNRGILPVVLVDCSVEIQNHLTGERGALPLSVALMGREPARTPIRLVVEHCGAVTVRLVRPAAQDPFGLFSRPLACAALGRAMVPPQVRPLALSPAEDPVGDASPQRPGNDPSETFQIREYAPGDPVRRIHWKLTEKLDKPLVRDFGLPPEARLVLSLERADVSWDRTDRALDDLFSAGQALCDRGLLCTVRWPSQAGQEEASLLLPGEWQDLKVRLLSAPLPPVVLTAEGFDIPPSDIGG